MRAFTWPEKISLQPSSKNLQLSTSEELQEDFVEERETSPPVSVKDITPHIMGPKPHPWLEWRPM